MRSTQKGLRWCAGVTMVVALAACESTPAGPAGGSPADSPAGDGNEMTVTTPILGAVPVASEVDGHVYDAVSVDGGIDWDDARAAAEAMVMDECQGYLVSITSAEENDLILSNFPEVAPFIGNGYWIGAYQAEDATAADAGWAWVSGEPFGSFTDWAAGVPDDAGVLADEDAASCPSEAVRSADPARTGTT